MNKQFNYKLSCCFTCTFYTSDQFYNRKVLAYVYYYYYYYYYFSCCCFVIFCHLVVSRFFLVVSIIQETMTDDQCKKCFYALCQTQIATTKISLHIRSEQSHLSQYYFQCPLLAGNASYDQTARMSSVIRA